MTHAASNKDAKISHLEVQNTALINEGNKLNKGEVCENVIFYFLKYNVSLCMCIYCYRNE